MNRDYIDLLVSGLEYIFKLSKMKSNYNSELANTIYIIIQSKDLTKKEKDQYLKRIHAIQRK